MNKQALRAKVDLLDVKRDSIVLVRLVAIPNPQQAKEIGMSVEANIRAVCPDFKGRILMLPPGMSLEVIPPVVLEGAGWVRAWEPLPMKDTAELVPGG